MRYRRRRYSTVRVLRVVDDQGNLKVGVRKDLPVRTEESMLAEIFAVIRSNDEYDSVTTPNPFPDVYQSLCKRICVSDIRLVEEKVV